MCVNFTDLKNVCPKDGFLLPRIDQLVYSMVRYKLLSFMDAFLEYNQIRMYGLDQKKTVFITDQGLYYYRVVLFGLKNAEANF